MGSLRKLVDGYQRFQKHYFSEQGRELYKELAVGQHPDTMVIACSDSRVDPALVLDCKPGDLFVVRNVANLVPPYETGGLHHGVSAALEFAVNILEVTNVIVLGHHQCGGIKALLDDNPAHQGGFIKPWMNMAKRAADRVKAEHFTTEQEKTCQCEMAGILLSLENLHTFPFIQTRLDQKKLRLHGWYFDVVSGEMLAHDPAQGKFTALISAPAALID